MIVLSTIKVVSRFSYEYREYDHHAHGANQCVDAGNKRMYRICNMLQWCTQTK